MLRAGHIVIAAALALLMLGVVMVNSAGMEVAKTHVTVEGVLLSKSTIYMGIALATMAAVSWLTPVRLIAQPPAFALPRSTDSAWGGWNLKVMWALVFLMLAVLALVYLPGLGDARKGSHRWIKLGLSDLTLQPSEFAKWFLVGLVAWYSVVMSRKVGNLFNGLLPILAAVGIVAGFVAIEDLGTAILLFCVSVVTILAAGAKLWHFLLPLPAVIAGGIAMVKLEPYRMARITAFLDPYAAPRTSGYHMIQSQVAIANGEIAGRGLGNGLQKFGYLPEDTTDFIFAIICEELGLIGAVLVVSLFCTLILAGLAVVIKQRTTQAKVIALGITATVGIQAVINLFVVVGWGPTKGIALPLLSSGGTGWILTAAALGVLVALDRHASTDDLPDADPAAAPAAAQAQPKPLSVTTTSAPLAAASQPASA